MDKIINGFNKQGITTVIQTLNRKSLNKKFVLKQSRQISGIATFCLTHAFLIYFKDLVRFMNYEESAYYCSKTVAGWHQYFKDINAEFRNKFKDYFDDDAIHLMIPLD